MASDLLQLFCLAAFIGQLFLCKELRHTSAGRNRGLHSGNALGKLAQRGGEQPYIQHKGDHNRKRYGTAKSQRRACDTDCGISKIAHKSHKRRHQAGQKFRAESMFSKPFITFLKYLQIPRLPVISADNILACVLFLYVGIYFPKTLLSCGKVFL